ncbi:MAG: peptidyl-prolyl cis-trans isomerase [Desulfuromonadaceae bacterium]|nr:peptidyl-prolyl cis-trans isomerase [Desulfuromonadaceae bacterium]
MRRIMVMTLCLLLFAVSVQAKQQVLVKTNMGDIKLELDEKKAPISVKNFLAYVDSGFYKNTIFHRVIKDFMIQGGGFDTAQKKKETRAPIKNEATNGLKNQRGTIAMARTSVVDSATAQFFINLKDNTFLDYSAPNQRGYGYAVFGQVVEGMAVVDKIGTAPTRKINALFQDMPTHQVVITDIVRVEAAPKKK